MEAINAKRFRKIADRIRYIIRQLRESGASIRKESSDVFDMIDDLAKEALITPPRNCDVGNADEQYARFNEYCNARHKNGNPNPCGRADREDSPCDKCYSMWAQMPYEADAEKEGDGDGSYNLH